jgi:hypothetical protein
MAVAEAQGLPNPVCVILVGWCFDTLVEGFSLYDRYKSFYQSLLNN